MYTVVRTIVTEYEDHATMTKDMCMWQITMNNPFVSSMMKHSLDQVVIKTEGKEDQVISRRAKLYSTTLYDDSNKGI